MKILIVGEPGPSQQLALNALGVAHELPENPQGVCLDYTFVTKYFEQEVGIWVDQFTDSKNWAESFSSDAAAEVRKALIMVIFTLVPTSTAHLENLELFINSMKRECPETVIAGFSAQELSLEEHEHYFSCGIDVMEGQELLDGVHAAIMDWEPPLDHGEENENGEPFERPEELMEPLISDPMDLGEIMKTLREARDSNATEQEKMALAERLARQLVP